MYKIINNFVKENIYFRKTIHITYFFTFYVLQHFLDIVSYFFNVS